MPASKGWIGRRDRLMAQTTDPGPGAVDIVDESCGPARALRDAGTARG